ncbi:hypothetical protein [Streptomyces sp. NPDC006879]|uniref:hypothetical protein n=1 Tax=Streptomyces sp. NPDC006879 TaxID=3364767 RepID=UPI0036B77C67
MTVVVLDRPPATGALPYAEWLAGSGRDLVLLTGTPGPRPGFTEVHVMARYAVTAAVETTVLALARRSPVTAVVALDPADQLRAGALRDLLGVPGQSRDTARLLLDPIASADVLRRSGIPVVRRAEVRRVLDLYRYGHEWGYPLVVRRRRAAGRRVLAVLEDEAALRSFVRGGLTSGRAGSVPDLTVEPPCPGARHVGPGLAVTDAALAALPVEPGHPRVVEAVRADGDWLIDGVRYEPAEDPRAQVRAQVSSAGLALEGI